MIDNPVMAPMLGSHYYWTTDAIVSRYPSQGVPWIVVSLLFSTRDVSRAYPPPLSLSLSLRRSIFHYGNANPTCSTFQLSGFRRQWRVLDFSEALDDEISSSNYRVADRVSRNVKRRAALKKKKEKKKRGPNRLLCSVFAISVFDILVESLKEKDAPEFHLILDNKNSHEFKRSVVDVRVECKGY